VSEVPWDRASLIIPVARDDERLASLLDELDRAPEAAKLEVVIVDNQSRDLAAPLTPGFERAGRRYKVARATIAGKGAAVTRGMVEATRELRVFTDVDLPYGFEGIAAVVAALALGRAPIVLGSRLVAGARAEQASLLRRLFGLVFRWWTRLCLGAGDLGDSQCGLKGFRADVAVALFTALRTQGFAFDCEVLARARRAGHAIDAVPVTLRPSKGTSVNVIRDALRMSRDVLRIRRILKDSP
jgi:dolichyl-phosphate beta-glucosyltransferase